MISAWVTGSSALVGSSAMSSAGRCSRASAMHDALGLADADLRRACG